MIRLKPLACLLLLFFCSRMVIAQNFGGNPGNIRWKQINTAYSRIIFPRGLDSIANHVATITEILATKHTGTIGNRQRKIPIVLQPNNTLSNAYVQLGPWRSEFYLTPPQNPFELGSLYWPNNLAVHEYRHALQYSNFNVGLSRVFSVLFGQQGQAFANAVAVPDWFFEGDAVWNETVYSRQGRGRLPQNFNAYKSLYYGGKDYSFMKLRNGSLRDFIPNHYDLGYLLVAYGREKYGDSIWQKISHDAAAFKGLFYPWQKAVQAHMGISYTQFVKDTRIWYQTQWDQEKTPEPSWITPVEKHNVVNYRYPYPYEEGGMVCYKNSYTENPSFIIVKENGTEEKIDGKDIGYDSYFSYRHGRIVYTATRKDLRWDNRDYSDIRVLDVHTGRINTVTSKSKYFSPDISSDGDRIVAVEANPSKQCMLHIMDSSGTVLQSWTADPLLFYSHPKYTSDDKQVIVAARRPGGDMGWMSWTPATNSWTWILNPANRIVGYPVITGDSLFYTGTAGKADAMYVIDLSKASAPVVIAKYQTGIYQGFEQNGKIIGSAFTADGYRVGAFDRVGETHSGLLEDLYTGGTLGGKENILQQPLKIYPSKNYSRLSNPFNFHSWQGEISDPDYTISLLGENILSSVLSEFYYTYNRNERSNKLGFTGTFGGSYVQPFIGGAYTWGREVALNTDTILLYNQFNGNAGLQLPLNFTFGKLYRQLNLSASINKETVRWTNFAKNRFRDLDFDYYRLRLGYVAQIQKAIRQINPRFAHSWVIDYRRIINTYTANQLLVATNIYVPGIWKTHSIVLTGAWHARDTMNQYIFSTSFPFSRGYSAVNYPRMYRLGINYHVPLFYPDWGFGNMIYFQRIRANVFYDFTQGKSLRTSQTRDFRSVGTEIYLDTKWWNQQLFTFGIRYSRLLDPDYFGASPNYIEIILPANILVR